MLPHQSHTCLPVVLFCLIAHFPVGFRGGSDGKKKYLPTIFETQVQSLGQEDPLKQQMATHSSMLAWRILWTEEPSGLQSMGPQRVRYN